MKITIIETGKPPPKIRAAWPGYPDMFVSLVGGADPGLSFEIVDLVDGEPLPDPSSLEAVLVTGSKAGVYDDEPWMAPLMDFIRWTAAEEVPQIGVCFGHQAVAQALGGQVIKSPKGWGLGRHTYDIENTFDWMGADVPSDFALAVSHQDQVVAPPPGAKIIAASGFTPYAALAYAQGPAISFQGHPEFSDGFSAALYDVRLNNPLSAEEVDAAKTSLSTPEDNALVGRWMAQFYRSRAKAG